MAMMNARVGSVPRLVAWPLQRSTVPVRGMCMTAPVLKKSAPGRGRTRKSPATLLRMHAEGKLKGAEAAAAVALQDAQGTAKVEETSEKRGTQSMALGEARQVIRVRMHNLP